MIKKINEELIRPVSSGGGIGATMIHITLCDDDPLFLEWMQSEIRSALKDLKVDALLWTYKSAEEIPEQALGQSDLFFLDVDFAGKRYTGIDIAKKIRSVRQDSVIVFLTNYIEYAPEGYEVQAFRYVLKSEVHQKLPKTLLDAISKLFAEKEFIQISISGEPITLYLEDILYVESQAHTAIIYTHKTNGAVQEYRFYASLAALEKQWAEQGFLRIQKSYLVNMRRIQQYRCDKAVLDNGEVLPVSEKTYAQQKKKYMLWKEQNRWKR